MISWFSQFAFKWVNLYRYDEVVAADLLAPPVAGLYTLHPVDP